MAWLTYSHRGVAKRLVLDIEPAGAVAGVAFGTQPVGHLVDGSGLASRASGIVVTAVKLSGTGTLGGTLTAVTDDEGVFAFTDLEMDTATGSVALQFTVSGLVAVTSAAFPVTTSGYTLSADAASYAWTGAASTLRYGRRLVAGTAAYTWTVATAATRRTVIMPATTRLYSWTPTAATLTYVSTTFDYYIGPSGSDSNAGTFASPWAITALWTKAATYKGKSLGILDGTYHGYNGTQYNGRDAAYYIPATAVGTSGARTVISGVTARGAVLVGDGGNLGGSWSRAQIGVWVNAAYVTIQNLEIKESAQFGLFYAADNCRGFGNEVHRVDRVTYGDNVYNNQTGINSEVTATNLWLAHNYVHDIVAGGGGGYNESCIELYHSQNAIVEYNECTDASTGIFLKEDCGGSIVRSNYVYGCAQALYYGTNDAFAATWHGNVVTGWSDYLYRRDNNAETAGTKFYNNTFIVTAAALTGLWIRATSGNVVDAYNNLMVRQGGSDSSNGGDVVAGGSATFGVADYNLYGTTVTFGSPDYTPLANFAAYKTAIGSKEAHSVNANPTFASGGTGPYQWKLAGGSRGVNEGSSDGTTGGSAVNIGAFVSSGQTEQIGPDWRWPA